MREFFFVLAIIFGIEGSWTEIDGGTKYGITAATLSRANRLQIVQTLDISNLTKRDATIIYYRMFWIPSGAYKFPYPLNLVIFDGAVHLGPSRAKSILRAAVRDSSSLQVRVIACRYVYERYRRLTTLKNYSKNRNGWRRRLQIIYNYVNDTKPRKFCF